MEKSLRRAGEWSVGRLVIEGFVTTTEPVAVYGGVQVPEEEMPRIADQIRHSGLPMLAQHDERTRLSPKLLQVDVRRTDSGALGVWIEFEVDEEAWRAVGDLRAFSVALLEPYAKSVGGDTAKPRISIASDAGHFDDALRDEVAAALEEHFDVASSRLYLFSAEPPAKVVIEFAVPLLQLIQSIGINVFSSVLWDGLKLLMQRRKKPQEPMQLVFEDRRPDGSKRRLTLWTSDPEVAKHAIDKLPEIATSGRAVFDERENRWQELDD